MTLRILVAVIFIAASVSSAPALKKAPSPATPTPTQAKKYDALTEGECRGLGGTVVTANGCGSPALACETADKNGVLRRACIDNVKH